MFVTLEGVDGAGKSTQAKLLAEALGADTLLLREPGGTDLGERLRSILKDPAVEMTATAELLLFCAARAQLVRSVIRPALEAGRSVVCDRFVDSTVAYQGDARGLDPGLIEALNAAAVEGCMPSRTIVLALDPERATERARGRCATPISDRFEDEGLEFQRRIAAAFRRIAAADPGRVEIVDAEGGVEEVHARVVDALGLAR